MWAQFPRTFSLDYPSKSYSLLKQHQRPWVLTGFSLLNLSEPGYSRCRCSRDVRERDWRGCEVEDGFSNAWVHQTVESMRIALAKFLLESHRGRNEYDQSHLPPGQQYGAVGHAGRATYFYSGMADIAAETQDRDYQSAVISLWDNMVNKKYYLTGGTGSGETSEGFGPNYSLRNEAYCENAQAADLSFANTSSSGYTMTRSMRIFTNIQCTRLCGLALDGQSYCYTNPLVNRMARRCWRSQIRARELSGTTTRIPRGCREKSGTRIQTVHGLEGVDLGGSLAYVLVPGGEPDDRRRRVASSSWMPYSRRTAVGKGNAVTTCQPLLDFRGNMVGVFSDYALR